MPEFKSTEQLRAEALLEKKDKLRDKFAAAALTGILANPNTKNTELVPRIAYAIANSMLLEKLNNPLK
jgi:hypothetical protein